MGGDQGAASGAHSRGSAHPSLWTYLRAGGPTWPFEGEKRPLARAAFTAGPAGRIFSAEASIAGVQGGPVSICD